MEESSRNFNISGDAPPRVETTPLMTLPQRLRSQPTSPSTRERTTPTSSSIRTTSVLLVEQSRGGSLAQTLRKKMKSLAPILGNKFKIVENTRTSLSRILSNKNLWPGTMCGRKKCFPCKQQSEKREQCSYNPTELGGNSEPVQNCLFLLLKKILDQSRIFISFVKNKIWTSPDFQNPLLKEKSGPVQFLNFPC